VLCLGGGLPVANAIVLCVGEDGHVALELSHDGGCTGGAREQGPKEPAHVEGIESCGSCIDIPLWGSLSGDNPFRVPAPVTARAAFLAAPIEHGPQAEPHALGLTELPFVLPSHLPALRAVVLLV